MSDTKDYYIHEYTGPNRKGLEVFHTEIVCRVPVNRLVVDFDGTTAIWGTSDPHERKTVLLALERLLGYTVVA